MKIFGFEFLFRKVEQYPLLWVRYDKKGRIGSMTKRMPKDYKNWVVYRRAY